MLAGLSAQNVALRGGCLLPWPLAHVLEARYAEAFSVTQTSIKIWHRVLALSAVATSPVVVGNVHVPRAVALDEHTVRGFA